MIEIKQTIKDIFPELVELNEYIYKHPELGHKEEKACKAHVNMLRKYGFDVEEHFIGIQTAFKATYDSKITGPTIAVMCEYDALPGIGHGCGHNMIGTVGTGVGIVLKSYMETIGGKIIVLGTPAEETDGAKVDMADQGVFDHVDIAMMAHPSSKTYVSIESLAMEAIEFEFLGKAAHAAAAPEKGINALDAVISTFNNINALREHITSTTRIHGIIKEGGVAANIVPERAVAHFYVRATTKTYLKEVIEKVKNCARGAALATGAELNIRNYEKSYDNFVKNKTFNNIIKKNFVSYGFGPIEERTSNLGSLDAGNVSQVCPTVHPMFSITEVNIPGHTRKFGEATVTPYALEKMKDVIGALVQSGLDIINDNELLSAIQKEFHMTEK